MQQRELVKLFEYRDLLLKYLYKYGIGYDDAQDIIQEFLIKMIDYNGKICIEKKPNYLFLYICMRNSALDFKKKRSLMFGKILPYDMVKNSKTFAERLESILRTNESILKYNNDEIEEYDNKLKFLCTFLDSPDGLILDDFYLNKKSKKSYDKSYYKKYRTAKKIQEQIKHNYETWNNFREDI
jgi:hypothetical protein